ncbi:uncharacterized protein LOC108682482 isoform X2 [Hyalella azteca]|uniref:Uncharacterized protein LOC108682482 isoform X2 n=1 Tax=Hyalella azteca TaxID=294128 RepID=A0A8B7PNX4_HYAAZ|nr:uncharacterized protein LOC108682482 isoform X2 [Hyalella azteca]
MISFAFFVLVTTASVYAKSGCLRAIEEVETMSDEGCVYMHRDVMKDMREYEGCALFKPHATYDKELCDPMASVVFRCVAQKREYLAEDETFDVVAFKSNVLNNECDEEPEFDVANEECVGLMDHFNVVLYGRCLDQHLS